MTTVPVSELRKWHMQCEWCLREIQGRLQTCAVCRAMLQAEAEKFRRCPINTIREPSDPHPAWRQAMHHAWLQWLAMTHRVSPKKGR